MSRSILSDRSHDFNNYGLTADQLAAIRTEEYARYRDGETKAQKRLIKKALDQLDPCCRIVDV